MGLPRKLPVVMAQNPRKGERPVPPRKLSEVPIPGTLLTGLEAPLIASALGIGGGAGKAGKGLLLSGSVGGGKRKGVEISNQFTD